MTKFGLLLVLPIALAFGQTAPSPSSAETAKKATIEGVVVNETTKEPLRRVEISLYQSGKNGGGIGGNNSAYSAVTDAAGKFRIEDIEPGEYIFYHHRTGYVDSRAAFGASSQSLKLGTGETLTDLHYSLLPQAIIAGRVIDDEGEPVQDAGVMLMHSQYRRGSAHALTPAAQAQTNDRGEFRLINVQPGKYYIQANPQRIMSGGSQPASAGTADAPRTVFVPTYYPSAAEMAQATRIEAQAGLELSGRDITLRKEKVLKVSGKVLDTDGSPAERTFVMLMLEDGFLGYSNEGSRVDNKGNFTINGVRPGQYTVVANRPDGQTHQSAQTSVTVEDFDVTSVALQMMPALETKGSIVLEGSDRKDFDFSDFSVHMNPSRSFVGGAGAQAKPDGTFTISHLSPGHYFPNVYTGVGEAYVQSVQVGGEDVYGKEVDAATLVASGLRVVVRLDSARVSGTVEIPEDRKQHLRSPVVLLLPADARLRNAGQSGNRQLEQTGSFEFKNIRPGDYLGLALEECDSGSLDDPEVLAALESKATKVSLSRGESKQLTLKLVPWPEEFADRLQ
jgi:protocatechuate 3,4-dioxygenase beta subunit